MVQYNGGYTRLTLFCCWILTQKSHIIAELYRCFSKFSKQVQNEDIQINTEYLFTESFCKYAVPRRTTAIF
jgi:hypothetical protein